MDLKLGGYNRLMAIYFYRSLSELCLWESFRFINIC